MDEHKRKRPKSNDDDSYCSESEKMNQIQHRRRENTLFNACQVSSALIDSHQNIGFHLYHQSLLRTYSYIRLESGPQ